MATASRYELNKQHHELRSLNEVIAQLCGKISKAQFMGGNCMVVGEASRFAKITVESSGTHEHWTTLRIEIFVGEKSLTVYTVRFDSTENAPAREEWNNPAVGGGHVWRSCGTLEWYNWRPRPEKIEKEIRNILEFHEIL